jgi:hypothetical protein
VLAFAGTDDPAHGQQEGIGYHGSYRQDMYPPRLVFDGETGHRITAVRRPGRCHGSRFALLVRRWLGRRRRHAGPDLARERRADSGVAIPRVYAGCAAHAVRYTIGLIPHSARERRAAPRRAVAQACRTAPGGAQGRRVAATAYQARRWPRARRVVMKAAILPKGPNTRFVVSTRHGPPEAIYDWYVERGEPENWLKDLKNALEADRLSAHRFWANALRLLLHAAA